MRNEEDVNLSEDNTGSNEVEESGTVDEQTGSSNETTPAEPETEHAATSDVGAIIADRYLIDAAASVLEDRIVYRATEKGHLRWCAGCRELYVLDQDDEFCDECGAELGPGWYRLTRWATEQGPAGVDSFVQANLGHDVWLSPTDWFVCEGQRYMIQEWFGGRILADMPGDHKSEVVLAWGSKLAEGMQVLHESGFAGIPLGRADLAVSDGDEIKLLNWGPFSVFPSQTEMEDDAFDLARQADLRSLSLLITDLLSQDSLPNEQDENQTMDPVLLEILSDMAQGGYDDALSASEDLSERLHGEEPVQVSDIELAQREALSFDAGARSHAGRVRPLNEDSIALMEFEVVRDSLRENAGLYVVADGVGGHDSGEIASRVAAGTMARYISERLIQSDISGISGNPDEPTYGGLIGDAVRAANQAVVDAGPDNNASNMGTTLTAALVVGSFAYIANVGDSRTYLFRNGVLSPITTDHSVVARLVAIGMIEPEDVYTHPQRNYVYRALGSTEDFQVDTYFQPLLSGDRLILCSDGLWEMVHDPELQSTLVETDFSQAACDRLVELANANGGEDNISIIIVRGCGYEDAG
ncbi:MAG: SpoIIE family protein phosphatase [Candidatus Latescibacteria bacterium]|jgi:PPM family protein phosphatase|nr:SpoIIE family protein phosphatase [Candidatus Latescibacterota bacterium]